MSLLLPRLPSPACETIVRTFLELGPERWPGFTPEDLPSSVRFAATGGTPLCATQLNQLRTGLEELARNHGFGGSNKRNFFAEFDAKASAWLVDVEAFSSGEALRDDVWSFVAAVVAPDIVYWRFGASMQRYMGGVRNTFQRLWMRGRSLDRGPEHPERWNLLAELTEDALVQITERPSIGSDPMLSLAVAEAWLRASTFHGRDSMQDIMRQAILGIRIRNEVRSLSDLPQAERASFLNVMFRIPNETEAIEAGRATLG